MIFFFKITVFSSFLTYMTITRGYWTELVVNNSLKMFNFHERKVAKLTCIFFFLQKTEQFIGNTNSQKFEERHTAEKSLPSLLCRWQFAKKVVSEKKNYLPSNTQKSVNATKTEMALCLFLSHVWKRLKKKKLFSSQYFKTFQV